MPVAMLAFALPGIEMPFVWEYAAVENKRANIHILIPTVVQALCHE